MFLKKDLKIFVFRENHENHMACKLAIERLGSLTITAISLASKMDTNEIYVIFRKRR